MNAVPQVDDVEVQQQANRQTAQSQIGQKLRPMHREHLFHRLEFEDNRVLHDEVESIPGVHMNIAIADRQTHLGFEAHGDAVQFVCEAGAVRALEQARSEFLVNGEGSSDDAFRQGGMKKHAAYSVSSASSAMKQRSQDGSQF